MVIIVIMIIIIIIIIIIIVIIVVAIVIAIILSIIIITIVIIIIILFHCNCFYKELGKLYAMLLGVSSYQMLMLLFSTSLTLTIVPSR